MTASRTTVFDLPDRLAAKADPALIAADEQHFAALAESLQQAVTDLQEQLDVAHRAPGGRGTAALERDQEVHRLTARLRTLRRYGLDLCLGRMVDRSGTIAYIGRLGLRDRQGRPLLTDWRAPAAEPFFAATHAQPMGLVSRRRYHWTKGRIADYWDEVFTPEGLLDNAALDDQSAFIASLGGARSGRMRDVLTTIQADQDAIIRASSGGALVVDGGPGTGKTVVALHRTAYLLYADPHLGHRRGGVLFVGPSVPYLAYVSDVLPSLGEEGVLTCTLRDLVPEGATAGDEPDAEVARIKADARMLDVIEPAVALYEEPPTDESTIDTPWGEVVVDEELWVQAYAAVDPDTPHNEARGQIWAALAESVTDQFEEDADPESVQEALRRDPELVNILRGAWPMLDAGEIVADLWAVPAYLRRCAPWLAEDEARRLRRPEDSPWTVADLPLLDGARRRLGDPEIARRRRQRHIALVAERERMDRVVDDLITYDDTEMRVMSMLRGADLRDALDEQDVVAAVDPDVLAGPFAHVVVDEAQELTDAEWQQLRRRCPSGSFTIVGDRAQARHGFPETWVERLERVGIGGVTIRSLSINYRTPQPVMAEAEPVIRAALPDANVPVSIRAGLPVVHGSADGRDEIVAAWLDTHADGLACVIGDPAYGGSGRVHTLTPELAKGLEFDLVVLVRPEAFGSGIEGAVDRYVAMTRATSQLVILC